MMTKFNVGDKVRMLNKDGIIGANATKNGGVYEVIKLRDGGIYINDKSGGVPLPIFEREYRAIELVVETPKKSARITALESQVAALEAKVVALEKANEPTLSRGEEAGVAIRKALDKIATKTVADAYPLTERFERESTSMDGILADIKRKAKPTLEALLATYPTPNEQRADVIKRAKAFVERLTERGSGLSPISAEGNVTYNKRIYLVEYHVNTEKRTVVALAKGNSGIVYERGIAKCDPDDVFNADIGKAIALARALGVEVPVEFVKAVQPTEVVVGHKLTLNDTYGTERGGTVTHFETHRGDRCAMFKEYGGASVESADGKATLPRITDDTDAVYE